MKEFNLPIFNPIYPNAMGRPVSAEILVFLACVGFALLCAYILEAHIAKQYGKGHKLEKLLAPTTAAALLILRFGYTLDALKGFIFFLLLFYATVSDFATREVADGVPLMIGLIALIEIGVADLPGMLLATVVITIPQLAVAVLKPGTYGGADIKLMAASAFLLGTIKGLLALITGLGLAVAVTMFIRKCRHENAKEPFALVPFLSAGCFLAYIL